MQSRVALKKCPLPTSVLTDMGHERIAEILCRRDGITVEEAQRLIDEAIEQMEACGYDSDECEDIMADVLGLEPDYIFYLLL